MVLGTARPPIPCTPSQTENLTERPPGSLFGDNPSGWALGRMRRFYMGRANPFMALVARLTADESCCSEKPSTRGAATRRSASASSPRPPRPTGPTQGARDAARAAPGGKGPPRPASRGGAAAPAAGGSPPSRAPSWSTAESRCPSWSPSLGSCVTTCPSSARPSRAASPARRPSNGGTACSPRYPATRTGSCRATPSRWTRLTSTTPTSPRATGRPGSAAYPARSRASASQSMSTRIPSRSSATTGSLARRA